MINLINKALKKASLQMGETKKSKLSKPATDQMMKHITQGENLRKELSSLASKSTVDKKSVKDLGQKTVKYNDKMIKYLFALKPYKNGVKDVD